MIVFLIHFVLGLTLSYMIYHFLLRKEKMHQFNRFYLISILVLSVVVPLLNIRLVSDIVSPVQVLAWNASDSFGVWSFSSYLWTTYFLISGLFLLRFFYNLWTIIRKIRASHRVVVSNRTFVLVEENILPHTFLHFIFVSREEYEKQRIEEELFTHEQTHASEYHTLDVLFVELYQCVFWFNPVLILVKKAIRLNHEFIADEKVIRAHQNIPEYQYLLLDLVGRKPYHGLSSSINYSITKRRFNMMGREPSKWTSGLIKLMVAPVLLLFVFMFSGIAQSHHHHHFEHHGLLGGEHHGTEHLNMESHEREHHE